MYPAGWTTSTRHHYPPAASARRGEEHWSSWDAILQVDDCFRGTEIYSGGEKSCRTASVTPALGQEELIPRCRTVRKTLNSGDEHAISHLAKYLMRGLASK